METLQENHSNTKLLSVHERIDILVDSLPEDLLFEIVSRATKNNAPSRDENFRKNVKHLIIEEAKKAEDNTRDLYERTYDHGYKLTSKYAKDVLYNSSISYQLKMSDWLSYLSDQYRQTLLPNN